MVAPSKVTIGPDFIKALTDEVFGRGGPIGFHGLIDIAVNTINRLIILIYRNFCNAKRQRRMIKNEFTIIEQSLHEDFLPRSRAN